MRNSISAFSVDPGHSHANSLSQIEQQLLGKQRGLAREASYGSKHLLPKTQNVDDLKVSSPFYVRPQHCDKRHCFCPYHRKLRIKQLPDKRQINRRTQAQTSNNSPSSQPKSQAKDQPKMQSYCSPIERKQAGQTVNTTKIQGRAKVQSHNYEFDQFLARFQQILLKKRKLGVRDLHRIKSSVGQIFKYIYTHLHEENEVVQQHISKIEKDRDFTSFYMQRYIELKAKGCEREETEQPSPPQPKTTLVPAQQQSGSRGKSKARNKLHQRRQLAKKTIRARSQKLMIQQMLQDIGCGGRIEAPEIQKFALLQPHLFNDNCQFLTTKIKDMDEDLLGQVLNQIVIKARNHDKLAEDNQASSEKVANLDKLIDLINGKIKQLEREAQQRPISFRTNSSSRTNNRASSNHSLCKNKRLTLMGKTRDSAFSKSAFNHLRKDGKYSQIYNGSLAETLPNQGQGHPIDTSRQDLKALTACAQGDGDSREARRGKGSKLNLGIYRRLSHEVFLHNKMLNEQQEQVISKMKIATLADMDQQLDILRLLLAEKKQRIKEIEGKIEDSSLKFMVREKDSLITAKRKIRLLKSLLKNEQFDPVAKSEIADYLTLMEVQNYVKNRKWASRKIRNDMQLGPSDQAQLVGGDCEQGKTFCFRQLIGGIFDESSKLFYYDLSKTSYEEKEINFEQHLAASMKSSVGQERKCKEGRAAKKLVAALKRKPLVKEAGEKENALLQVGLNYSCLSNYLMLEGQQQPRGSRGLRQEQQSHQPTQDTYLHLPNKLFHFAK